MNCGGASAFYAVASLLASFFAVERRSLHFVRFLSGAGFPEACFSFDGCDFVGGASDAGALEDLELAAD